MGFDFFQEIHNFCTFLSKIRVGLGEKIKNKTKNKNKNKKVPRRKSEHDFPVILTF